MDVFCYDCPRHCGAKRGPALPGGVCRSPSLPVLARAAAHFGEEPCISGSRGSGTLFFTGCNLRCVFCQNREISRGGAGETVDVPRLREIMLRLRDLYPGLIEQRYKFTPDPEKNGYELLEDAGRKRGFLVSGGEVDIERMAATLLKEFHEGKLGRISLEAPPKD